MSLFKMTEFVDMAIKDEDAGASFYQTLAEKTKSPDLKSEYLRIADQEIEHAGLFRAINEELGTENIHEEYPGQYDKYIDSLLENRAMTTPDKAADVARNTTSDREAIAVAIQMEKDTLLFYFEMKEFIPNTHKAVVEKIINEERLHVKDLNYMRELAAKL